MRNRILSSLAVVALALGGGGFALAGSADAAPVARVAAPVLSTTERGLCIENGTGKPQSLWLVAATGLCPKGFWGPASLEDAFGIDVSGLVKAEVARQLKVTPAPVVKDPAPAAEETAPVLSLNGSPGTASMALKWTAATPPAETTVVGYQVRYRPVTQATWNAPTGLSNILRYTVSLSPVPTSETSYFFQVRARYSTTTDFGGWSNTLSAATGDND